MKRFLSFINSPDVRAHLESIGWEPDITTASWLVYQSRNHTLAEKIEAWESIINGSDDTALDNHSYTLKAFLRSYTDFLREKSDAFKSNTDGSAVYSYNIVIRGETPIADSRLFSSSDKICEAIKEDLDLDDVAYFSLCKRYIDSERSADYLDLAPNGEVIAIEPAGDCMTDDEYEIFYETFFNMAFNIPMPDLTGKHVTAATAKYSSLTSHEIIFTYSSHSTESMCVYGRLSDSEAEPIDCYALNYLNLIIADADRV